MRFAATVICCAFLADFVNATQSFHRPDFVGYLSLYRHDLLGWLPLVLWHGVLATTVKRCSLHNRHLMIAC